MKNLIIFQKYEYVISDISIQNKLIYLIAVLI